GRPPLGSRARRPLSRSHRPRGAQAWRALVQRRDLCDLAPPCAWLSGEFPMTARLSELLVSASVEISSSGNQVQELAGRFAAGTDVSITFLPGDNYRHNVETAAGLRVAGFTPVPHIAAREMPSREALDDFLARLGGEANVRRVVLIAGDVAA